MCSLVRKSAQCSTNEAKQAIYVGDARKMEMACRRLVKSHFVTQSFTSYFFSDYFPKVSHIHLFLLSLRYPHYFGPVHNKCNN